MNRFEAYRFDGGKKLTLCEEKTDDTGGFVSKQDAQNEMEKLTDAMIGEQGRLYAGGEYALLIILQGMDASGKDSAIRHVMSGLDPQGTQVHSFKEPSDEELRHDYLWRTVRHLPERGKIGIFNRSYYEEVLVVRVHGGPCAECLPNMLPDNIWEKRYAQIRDFERYLCENGIIPLKFFLHISKEEQKKRLLSRIDDSAKNWKFSQSDIENRQHWDAYARCYEQAIASTATGCAPWYVVPADKKWFARLVIANTIVSTLKKLKLAYPQAGEKQKALLSKYRKLLLEDGRGHSAPA